jgi:hypothetical protein
VKFVDPALGTRQKSVPPCPTVLNVINSERSNQVLTINREDLYSPSVMQNRSNMNNEWICLFAVYLTTLSITQTNSVYEQI